MAIMLLGKWQPRWSGKRRTPSYLPHCECLYVKTGSLEIGKDEPLVSLQRPLTLMPKGPNLQRRFCIYMSSNIEAHMARTNFYSRERVSADGYSLSLERRIVSTFYNRLALVHEY